MNSTWWYGMFYASCHCRHVHYHGISPTASWQPLKLTKAKESPKLSKSCSKLHRLLSKSQWNHWYVMALIWIGRLLNWRDVPIALNQNCHRSQWPPWPRTRRQTRRHRRYHHHHHHRRCHQCCRCKLICRLLCLQSPGVIWTWHHDKRELNLLNNE